MSHRPGIKTLPVPSTVSAPAGAGMAALLPRATIRPSLMTTVWSGWAGAPVASITVTCVIASTGPVGPAVACAQAPAGHRSTIRVARHRLMVVCLVVIMQQVAVAHGEESNFAVAPSREQEEMERSLVG